MAATITVYGASDDLIEVDGDIYEEFPYVEPDRADEAEGNLLAFSDGTVLRIAYSSGVWRIMPVVAGTGSLSITQAPEDDDANYSDKATLVGPITWAVRGDSIAFRRGAKA